MTTRCCCWGRYSPYTKLLALEERALNADTPIIVGADAEDPPDATAPPARPALNAHFGDPALAALLPARSAAMAINFDLTLTFPHNFRLQNNSLRSRLAVQKQCMGACMVG